MAITSFDFKINKEEIISKNFLSITYYLLPTTYYLRTVSLKTIGFKLDAVYIPCGHISTFLTAMNSKI